MVTNHFRWDFIGLSTDEKPTADTSEKVADGSTYYCSDNSKLYVWYKDQWYEKEATGGGGGGTTYTAGDGIDITEGVISADLAQVTGESTTKIMSQKATTDSIDGRVKQNAGAPTTSTVGTIGQLIEDTTNGKLYQCTAIDTTDPQNPSYTWSEVGAGGGSSVTVVQTTGTSTTDVMSQDAVTSMVFADAGTDTKIQIGSGADGHLSDTIAIGSGATGYGTNSTIIGASASSRGNGIAIGKNAKAGNATSHTSAVAVGYNAQALNEGAIAIGRDSNASSKGEMNIGTTNPSWGYNSSNYRLISGVHDGQGAHDAVTVNQVNSVIDTINTALSTSIPHIGANS